MTFLAALLAWLVSLSVTSDRLPGAEPVQKAVHRVVRRLGGSTWVFLAVLFVPALVLAAVLAWFDLWIVTFLVSLGVLLLAFGPADQVDQLRLYRDYQADEASDQAYKLAVERLGMPEGLYEQGPHEMDQAVKHGLAYLLFQRFFVTLFWFVAFGAPGVVLVSLLTMIQPVFRAETAGPLAVQMRHAINWIPVRLLTLSLALVGNFAQSFAIWVRRVRDFEHTDQNLLASSVRAALPGEPGAQHPEDLLLLMRRAQILWLVVLALFTIFAW